MFLNQDTIVDPKAIEYLKNALDKGAENEVFCPMFFDYNFKYPTMIAAYLDDNPEYYKDTYEGVLNERYQIPTVGAACIALNSKLVESIGLFDPVFFMYGEGYDFFKRLENHGGKLFMIPRAKVAHRGGAQEPNKKKKSKRDLNYLSAQLIKVIRYGTWKQLVFSTIRSIGSALNHQGFKFTIIYIGYVIKVISKSSKIKQNDLAQIKRRINQRLLEDIKKVQEV